MTKTIIPDMTQCVVLSGVFVASVSLAGAKIGVGMANKIADPSMASAVAENSTMISAVTAATFLATMIGQSPAEPHKKKAAVYGAGIMCAALLLSHVNGDKIVDYPERKAGEEQATTVLDCNSYANTMFKPAFCP